MDLSVNRQFPPIRFDEVIVGMIDVKPDELFKRPDDLAAATRSLSLAVAGEFPVAAAKSS